MNSLKKYIQYWTPADYCLALLLITFPVSNKLMPILIIFLGLTLFIHRRPVREAFTFLSFSQPFLWFIIFFITHLIGLLYTENMESGVSDVGMKLSFILLPVMFALIRTKTTMQQIIDLFLFGLFIACFISYTYAIYRSLYNAEDNRWAYFTDSYLSFLMHRSYFATYLVIGILLLTHRFFKTRKWINASLIFLFTITTFLTFSKAGILILVVTMIPSIIYLSFKYYNRLVGIIISSVGALTIVLSMSISETMQVRFEKMVNATMVKTTNNPSIESSESRMIMWSTSLKVFRENPILGAGTGDVHLVLDEKNIELGNTGVAEKSLNSHNQYLNTFVQLGIVGGIPLIMIFVSSFLIGFRRKKFSLIVMTLVFILTLLFESFLETQAGIIPVTLLILVIALKSNDMEDLTINKNQL